MRLAQSQYAAVEVWCMDEHRLGLKPILGKVLNRAARLEQNGTYRACSPTGPVRVWAKRGQSLVAQVEHRFEWLYLYAFTCPESGYSHFWILPEVSIVAFERVLGAFARDNGVGADKHIVLVLDQAGWHVSGKLRVPEGISLVFLPSHAPELQPAERLWSLTDTPLMNKHFETLELLQNTLEPHLAWLETQHERIRAFTLFHWWPRITLLI